jgi:hypothetical protein
LGLEIAALFLEGKWRNGMKITSLLMRIELVVIAKPKWYIKHYEKSKSYRLCGPPITGSDSAKSLKHYRKVIVAMKAMVCCLATPLPP